MTRLKSVKKESNPKIPLTRDLCFIASRRNLNQPALNLPDPNAGSHPAKSYNSAVSIDLFPLNLSSNYDFTDSRLVTLQR